MPESLDIAEVLALDAQITGTTGSPGYGVTEGGFVPKPFARLLAEKLALARALFGDDIDLTSGSMFRKLFEVSALEDARTWATLADVYDSTSAVSAHGHALSRIGEEMGLPRPFLEARGRILLKLTGSLPVGTTAIVIPRGARLSTPGGHHVATEEAVRLAPDQREVQVPVAAFYPGPDHDLDPTSAAPDGTFPQKIDRWNRTDPSVAQLDAAERAASQNLVIPVHSEPLTGGDQRWPDSRYRQLLLQAPRSIWTVEAIQVAVSLVPGVQQVKVRDAWGGLDLHQSIFGNFNFIERLFSAERDLGAPYYFTVLVAPTQAAIWDGQDGLRASIESTIEDLRPISIFPQVIRAEEVGVGIGCELIVKGLPLPAGSVDTVNASPVASDLKRRILARVEQYISGLEFGEPVRAAEVTWAIMNEPGVVDVRNLQLLRYPPGFDAVAFAGGSAPGPQALGGGENMSLAANQVPRAVDDISRLKVV